MVSLAGFSSTNLTPYLQLFFDDEIRNKEVESLGKCRVTCAFASGADLDLPPRGDLLFGSGWG